LFGGLESEFGELDTFDAFEQVVFIGHVHVDVFEEVLPLGLEAVVVGFLLRHLVPIFIEVDGLRDVRIPDGFRCVSVVLDVDITQTCHGGAAGAIYLQGEEVIAPDAHVPGAVDMHGHPVLQFKGGIGGIVGGALVGLALLRRPFPGCGF
jgi:hypothetical protein